MEPVSIRLEKRHREIAEEMVENGDAEDQSKMVRNAIDHYATHCGYHINGAKHQTGLRRWLRRLGDALGLLALLWLGTTFYYPLQLRAPVIPILFIALTFHGIDRLLATREPKITNWLTTTLTTRGGNN